MLDLQPGTDHFYHQGDVDGILSAVQQFVTSGHKVLEDDRVLATLDRDSHSY